MTEPQRLRPIAVVVEDDWTVSRLIEVSLLQLKAVSVRVDRGDAAIEAILEHRPDLIVLDLALPGMNGWEILRQVRSVPEMRSVPVIVCTATAQPGMEYEARERGANALLPKPFSPNELRALAQQLLDGHDSTDHEEARSKEVT